MRRRGARFRAVKRPPSSTSGATGHGDRFRLMRGHAVSGLVALLTLVVSAGSCTGNEADQPVLPARPGAFQPPGGGAPISEDEACQRLTAAQEGSRRRLTCQELEHPACPYYVRPAGTGCWTYDEKSVEACEDFVSGYTSCSDFDDRPCVLTALPAPELSCPERGAGGEGGGGAAGHGGSAGEGGARDGGAGGQTSHAGQSSAGEGGTTGAAGATAAGGGGVPGAGSGSGGEGG